MSWPSTTPVYITAKQDRHLVCLFRLLCAPALGAPALGARYSTLFWKECKTAVNDKRCGV